MNQKGFAHIALMAILLVGLVAGVYLVQQTQIFKPKAAENQPLIYSNYMPGACSVTDQKLCPMCVDGEMLAPNIDTIKWNSYWTQADCEKDCLPVGGNCVSTDKPNDWQCSNIPPTIKAHKCGAYVTPTPTPAPNIDTIKWNSYWTQADCEKDCLPVGGNCVFIKTNEWRCRDIPSTPIPTPTPFIELTDCHTVNTSACDSTMGPACAQWPGYVCTDASVFWQKNCCKPSAIPEGPGGTQQIKTDEDCLRLYPKAWEVRYEGDIPMCEATEYKFDGKGGCAIKKNSIFRLEEVGGSEGCWGRNIFGKSTIELGTPEHCAAYYDDCNDKTKYPNFPNGGYCWHNPYPDEGGGLYACVANASVPTAKPASSGANCEDQYKYPECDWGTNQVYDVYQNTCTGNYSQKNHQNQEGQCGYSSQESEPSSWWGEIQDAVQDLF